MKEYMPLGDRVIIKYDIPEEKTQGGLYIPASVNKEGKFTGTIYAIGDKCELNIKIGNRILFVRPGVPVGKEEEGLMLLDSKDVGVLVVE